MRRTITENRKLAVWVAFCVGTLVVASVLTTYGLGRISRQSRDGAIAKTALCAFKADLQGRVNDARAFLITHPDGVLGIPASTIHNTILNEQATLHSLAILHC